MGLFQGSLSYSRFTVRGRPPKGFHAEYIKTIRLRSFSPLLPEDEVEQRTGWCAGSSVLDVDLTQDKVFYNGYLVLGLRTDRWRIPKPLLQAHYAEAAEALRQRSGRDKLSKKEKDDLRARIATKLRKKVFPSMRVVDCCWNFDRQEALFFSHSSRDKEEFLALFEQTFGLELDVESPLIAAHRLLPEPAAPLLETVEPINYRPRPARKAS